MLRVVLEGGPLTDGRAEAGIGRYVASLTTALAEVAADEGLEVIIATPRRRSRTERRPLRWLRSQPSLLGAALRRRAAMVHALGGEPSPLWPPHRQVVTVHDVLGLTAELHHQGRAARTYASVTAGLIRRCAAVVAVSDSVAAEIAELLSLDPSTVHVVGEGVSEQFSATVLADDGDRRHRAGAPGTPYVLWTGSLVAHDPRKALDTLVEAVAAVHARDRQGGGEGVTLVLAGRDGAEARRVEALAADRGAQVVSTGFVTDADLAALMRGAAVAVVPSLHEGFGLPALEAMACGAPLVASRTGNLPTLVGDAALLVDPGDAATLGDALAAVVAPGSDLAARLRRLGPPRAAPYTWTGAARRLAAVYRAAAPRP